LLASFEIPLEPVAAVRPKVTRFATYYPGRYGDYLPAARAAVADLWDSDPLEGLLLVRLGFVIPRPKSHYGTGRNAGEVKAGKLAAHPVPSPDTDNYAKAALDCLAPVVFGDDRQVSILAASKRYGTPGRTVVNIERATDGDPFRCF
jgi:Holliday junction resolvase RusA-like endonuclease